MKFEGEVRELELLPALVELGAEGFTGALRFENDSIIKIVYFKEGSVLSASTNDRADSIDEILLKSGKVSREHVKQALSKRKDDETLGDALLGLGFITRKELTWARRVQVVGILRSIVSWDTGSYTLVADYLPKREEGQAFQLEQIVLELVLTDGDRSKYDALLESGAVVFGPTSTFDFQFPRLGLNQEAESVVRLINGTRTATEVVAESTSDAFNVYKLIHALHLLGLLERSAGGFDQGFVSPEPIQPTIELPMDFGTAQPEMDLGAPSEPPVDDSWQIPAMPEAVDLPVSGGELLPSIDDDLGAANTPGDDYDYQPPSLEPEITRLDLGSDESSVETLSGLKIPEPSPLDEPEPAPAPRRVLVQSQSQSSGAGRKAALLIVLVLIVAALAYAGYVFFTRSDEPAPPVPQAEVTPQEVTPEPVATESSLEPQPAPATETQETPSETVQPEPVRPAPVQQTPPPAPASVPVPASSSRIAGVAARHARDAASVPFTVQFALLCQEYSVENALAQGGTDFWFVPINYQGRNCYRALWGRYPTRAEAERGAAEIPSSLRGGKAVVVEPPKF